MEKWDGIRSGTDRLLPAHAGFEEEYASLAGKWRMLPLGAEEQAPEGWLLHEFDDRKWDRTVIPGETAQEAVSCLYRRSFVLSRELGSRRIIFRLDCVPENLTLWINGQMMGRASGIFGTAEFDITEALRPDRNQVCVQICCTEGRKPVIQGDLGLYPLPHRCITDVQAVLTADGSAVQVMVHAVHAEGFTARVALMEENRVISFREATVEDGQATALLACPEVKLWNPENPALYRIAVILWDGIANYHTRELTVGFRRVEAKENRLLVNGVPERVYALDVTPAEGEDLEHPLRNIRNHHFNAIRISGFASEKLLRLCDRVGLYVLELTGAPEDSENARRLYSARSSHPCLLGWDLNEIGDIIHLAPELYADTDRTGLCRDALHSDELSPIRLFGAYSAYSPVELMETAAALAPIFCTYKEGTLTVVNNCRFTSTGMLEGTCILTRDGETVVTRPVSVDLMPGKQTSVPMETRYDVYKPGRYHLTAQFRREADAMLLGKDQFPVGVLRHIYDENPGGTIREEAGHLLLRAQDASYAISRTTACPAEMTVDGISVLSGPMVPVFANPGTGFRIPDEWERFTARWKTPKPSVFEVDQMTRTVTASFRLGSGLIQTYRLFADGTMAVELRLRTGKTAPKRIGWQCVLSDDICNCRWFGLGPAGCDPAHTLGRYFGIHSMEKPDSAFREPVYALTLTDQSGRGIHIRTEQDLRFALAQRSEGTVLTLELAQEQEYKPHTTYTLSFTLCPEI